MGVGAILHGEVVSPEAYKSLQSVKEGQGLQLMN